MKLVYCIHSLYNSGGTERVLTEKANYLCDKLGYDVTIVTSRQKGRPNYFPLSPNVRTVDIGVNYYRILTLGRYRYKLSRILDELKPDICISTGGNEIHVLSEVRDGSIKIAEYHFAHDHFLILNGRENGKAVRRTRRLERSAARMDKFVVLTREDAKQWRKFVPTVRQIYNPTPYRISRSSLDSKEFIAIGRFCKQKNFEMLVRVWKRVDAVHPEWKLRIIGDGEDRRKLEEMISGNGLEGKVLLNPATPDINERMMNASGLLMSSITEGFGMVLLEAASFGLPRISTDCKCGPSELINDGTDGFIVPEGDEDAFAGKICRLIEDEDLRKRMGAAATSFAGQFDKETIMKEWDNLFRSYEGKRVQDEGFAVRLSRRLQINWTRTRLIAEGHIFNPLWNLGNRRRSERYRVFSKILTHFMEKNCLSAANGIGEEEIIRNDDEKIFSIWFQGEENAPELVKSCFASIRRHCRQELVVLDERTVFDWIDLPAGIVRKFREGKIRYCHFSDICRVELLHRYGGYWLDSTCFVTHSIPEFIEKQDFFVFLAGKRTSGNYSFMQNCFIRARKGSFLLEAWRAMILEYWSKEEKRVDYFMHQMMFKTLVTRNATAAELFSKMPQLDQYPTHIIWYEDLDKPYDRKVTDRIGDEGFFYQKTTYRGSTDAVQGTWRDYITNYYKIAADEESNS